MPRKKQKEKKPQTINKLICGDNLEELVKLPKESIDLIYIDPPFFTDRHYEVVWEDEAEIRSFKDRWEGGIEHYIGWLKPRVQAMYETLSPTGSFYIHCDWHASAHIRIMLDEVFGKDNFINEIIWCYKTRHFSKKHFGRKHDTILSYSKSKNYTFNWQSVLRPLSESTIKKFKYKDEKGYYRLVGRGIKGSPIQSAKDVDPKWEREHPELVKRDYLKEGVPIEDYWYIDIINQASRERMGYPTQKPEALLERIIKASSNKDDVVADFFCGCGTTIAVAQQLGRKWVGIDISPTAIKVMQKRLKKTLNTVEGTNYEVVGMPTTVEEVKKLEPFDFQNWVIIDQMRAHQSRKKVGDMGIDGYIPKNIFTPEAGIQVKQSDGVGRNVVDNFETAIKRAGYKKGYIVAFSFSKGAYEEVARIKNNKELEIILVTVQELLEKKKPIM